MPTVTEEIRTALADRYVVESQLGEGGMATVYLAHDVKHNRKVALKVLRPELAAVIGGARFPRRTTHYAPRTRHRSWPIARLFLIVVPPF